MKLVGKVALITGGGRGIGEAIALAMAAEGAWLALAARTTGEVEQVAGQVQRAGGQAIPLTIDVSCPDDVQRMVNATLRHYGQIDILANAAGIYGPIGPAWEVDVDGWMRAMEINLGGTFRCCQAVLPCMIERRQGKIINFSGGGATSPLPRFTAYGVSKAAVVRLTETLAEEVRPFGIQVNAIAPGAVDTRLQDEVLAAGEKAGDLFQRIQELRATGKGGTPRELAAQLAVFLASATSDGLTGRLIAAPYDGWQQWDSTRIEELMALPWFTLRRMDPFTIKPFVCKVE
jgi:3-oxoacyl-[acyl-carrier protein] reductase